MEGSRDQSDTFRFADNDGVFTFESGAETSWPTASVSAGAASVQRPSLFSGGSATSSAVRLPSSSTYDVQQTLQQSLSPPTKTTHPARPLSTLTRGSPSQHHSHMSAADDLGTLSHRPRIPRAQKDADDPSTPVQNQDPFLRPENTTTSITRLFAMRTDTNNESRSPSYNTAQEYRPRSLAAEPASLTGHLYTQGLLSGRHSDITVNAFGCAYKLHRLMLDRSPFFSTALSGQWIESSAKEIILDPQDVDSNITQVCFELALKRLYGAAMPHEEATEAVGLFATGCWLEMSDLIDSSIESILRQMAPHTLNPLIKLVTSNYYGRAGDKILASAKAMLCRDGWKMALRYWDGLPADIIREIVGGDGFFVNDEWDRWLLAKRILNRRLRFAAIELGLVQPDTRKVMEAPDVVKLMAVRFDGVYRKNSIRTASGIPDYAHRWVSVYTNPEIEPLLVLLDEGIHYVHLDFEHLQYIRAAKDTFGLPLMPDKVISDALWMQMELRQKVLNVPDDCMELGLSVKAEDANEPPTLISPVSSSKGKGKKRQSDSSNSFEEDTDIPSNSWDGNGKPRKFWIPSADCNIVIGGNNDPMIATSTSPSMHRHVSRLSGTLQPEDVQWAADFGAASADTRPMPSLRPPLMTAQPSTAPEVKPVAYTHHPPFRFAAEFPSARVLKEKKRVYSRTIFYAGSLWNIYIQKVKTSRNSQLGVYLHRAKEREAEEAPVSNTTLVQQGNVNERIGLVERELLLRERFPPHRRPRRSTLDVNPVSLPDDPESSGSNDAALPGASTSSPRTTPRNRNTVGRLSAATTSRKSRQSTAEILSSTPEQPGLKRRSSADSARVPSPEGPSFFDSDFDSDGSSSSEHRTDAHPSRVGRQGIPALPPYVDARPTIRTYFKIYSPSKGGRMLSVYESAPDRFNFSQSWGWKSSTLMLDEGMDEVVGEKVDGVEGVPRRGEGRLRFMVVIGNV